MINGSSLCSRGLQAVGLVCGMNNNNFGNIIFLSLSYVFVAFLFLDMRAWLLRSGFCKSFSSIVVYYNKGFDSIFVDTFMIIYRYSWYLPGKVVYVAYFEKIFEPERNRILHDTLHFRNELVEGDDIKGDHSFRKKGLSWESGFVVAIVYDLFFTGFNATLLPSIWRVSPAFLNWGFLIFYSFLFNNYFGFLLWLLHL